MTVAECIHDDPNCPHWQFAKPGCEECGNDLATVTITSGAKVCGDCAEALDP